MDSKANHYIDNKAFLQDLIDFHKEREKNPKARVSEALGKAFILLCENLAKRSNFSGYSFRDDMVSDAIDNCLTCVANFDPKKSNNPFGYFTLVAYRAMIRRIQIEKKRHNMKFAILEQSMIEDTFIDDLPLEMQEQLREFSLAEWGNHLHKDDAKPKERKGRLDQFYVDEEDK